MTSENISPELVWEIVRPYNSYLVKSKNPSIQFSRDPLNLTNKHTRKYEGFADPKAVGVHLSPSGNGVVLQTKKPSSPNKPAASSTQTTFSSAAPRKTYRGIVNSTAKRGYRPDLRAEVVARASAIRDSQRKKKDTPERKPRGAKARKAAEASSS